MLTYGGSSYIWHVLARELYSTEQLEKLHQVYKRVFACSERIWKAVKHVLCDDSPEGHLPEEMEEIEGLDTKDLLSYSFRAVHESRYAGNLPNPVPVLMAFKQSYATHGRNPSAGSGAWGSISPAGYFQGRRRFGV